MNNNNENNSKVVLINDDKTTFDYATFVLQKVCGMDKKQSYNAAVNIDRHGEWVVLECSKQEAEDALNQIAVYNEVSGNNLMARVDPINTPSVKPEDVKLNGYSIILSQRNKILHPENNKEVVFAVMSSLYSSKDLNDKELVTQARHWMEDMFFGKEVLIKEFEPDEEGLKKANALMDLLEYKLETLPSSKGITLSLEEPGYVLKLKPNSNLKVSNKTIEEEQMGKEILGVIGGLVDGVEDEYIKDIESKYGSVENFLDTAPQDEIDEYNQVQEAMERMSEIKKEAGLDKSTQKPKSSI